MPATRVTLLGIGNVLWADEGFGVRAIETLNRHYRFPATVTVMDGGTQGIYLVQHVQAADVLVVFDAVDYGLAPGTLKLVEGEDVPHVLGARKMSLHQAGFQEVLAMAKLLGGYPRQLLLVGVQPEQLEDYGGSLRDCVRAQIGPAIAAAIDWLEQRGITAEPRASALSNDARVHPAPLDMGQYEARRPSADSACRVGDDRVLRNPGVRFDPKPVELGENPMRVDIDHRHKN